MSDNASCVLRELPPEYGFWRTRVPEFDPRTECAFARSADGVLSPLAGMDEFKAAAKNREKRFFAVARKTVAYSHTFQDVGSDDGFSWNFELSGSLSIKDHSIFISHLFKAFPGEAGQTPFVATASQVSDCFSELVFAPAVLDAIAAYRRETGYTFLQIKERDALSVGYWTNALCPALSKYGVTFDAASAVFLSPDLEIKDEEDRKAKAARELEQATLDAHRKSMDKSIREDEWREAERKRELSRKRYEDELARIESDRKRREAENATNIAKMQELAKLEIEGKRLEIERQREDAKARDSVALFEGLLAQLGSNDPSVRYTAQQELRASCGISLDTLKKLSPVAVQPAMGILETVKARVRRASGGGLKIRRKIGGAAGGGPCYTTRCIGMRKAKVPAIHNGDDLGFIVESGESSGCLTLLNIDSEANVTLLVPDPCNDSAIVPHIAKNVSESVPGSRYLDGIELFEMSDSGIESMVAIVSDRPIIPESTLARLRSEGARAIANGGDFSPTLTAEEIDSLDAVLRALQPSDWSAAMLEFMITPL